MGNAADIVKLKDVARRMRLNIVEMMGVGKTGHLGGSMSCADIVAALYFYKMRYDPNDCGWEGRDRFLFSKGHAALAQYAALTELGVLDRQFLTTVKQYGGVLQGHPDVHTPGVEANTGSLGQGVSVAVGMALGFKLDKRDNRVFVIAGDGEMAEGQIWEALMAADFYRLDNLTVILDKNNLQATGKTKERFDIGRFSEKFVSFGAYTIKIDGHDMGQITGALDEAETVKGRYTAIIAETVKGKGVSFAENVAGFHNGMLTREEYDRAMAELSAPACDSDGGLNA